MTNGKRALPLLARIAASLSLALPASGCAALSHGFLGAAGPVAAGERHEFLLVSGIMLLVIAPVLLLTPLIAWHYRLSNRKAAFRPQWGFSWALEGLIWLPPALVVAILGIFLWRDTQRFDPYRPLPASRPPLEIQAVALDWKWLFIYPEQHIASVNRLVLPADRPVHMSLTSATVMQSLLMPQLAGQIYAMAGMRTQLNFAVSAPGTYWGENTQFSGMGFQKQNFPVLGVSAEDFDRWVASSRDAPRHLDEDSYKTLARKGVVSAPITYGDVTPKLFKQIIDAADTRGASQQDRNDHHG